MYKTLTAADFRRLLNVPDNYRVDGLLVSGTCPKTKEYPHLYAALEALGIPHTEESLPGFFSDVKVLLIGGKRIWFDVVYGTAYLSELTHVASLLGSTANVLIGTYGALVDDLGTGDILIPKASHGNESSTRMYQRDNATCLYESDAALNLRLKENLPEGTGANSGTLVTVQAMLAETREDIDAWVKQGYAGVDMESATLFAVSKHFGVPTAALLYAADNLVKNDLITSPAYAARKERREAARRGNYAVALRTLIG